MVTSMESTDGELPIAWAGDVAVHVACHAATCDSFRKTPYV